MENQKSEDTTFEKFTWKIKNFSKLDSRKLYSESFSIDGHTWRILMFPKGNKTGFLSIYLDAGPKDGLPSGWTKFACFKLTLLNQLNHQMTQSKEAEHEFNATENDWGFSSFISLTELLKPGSGYIVNDTCIIEAEIAVTKPKQDQQDNKTPTPKQATQENAKTPTPEMSLTTFGELVDFKDFGKIEKAFVPLLEEVCAQHPSLIVSKKKRSRKFTEWAFTALGRVLHFLKTKKVKDMNDEACQQLQVLWEELETVKFDLTWLQPHVGYALSLKDYVEKDGEVKKMKENVADMKMKMQKLKAELFAAEVDFAIVKRDLVKKGFEERDLDAELGYGGKS
ncbi:hypothetical protein RJT34_23812 [Clitoria ternatea]|uniref:MATH domain-containing protein n=1 Tax=Clitoria ternatea TaxID=43366 RepID=A0AAN9FPP4_CLITE